VTGSKHVAFLRGINVGGKNKLPSTELAAMFVAAGCAEVTTYIQSGNVVFEAAPLRVTLVASTVASDILARFGYRVPVIVRSAGEMKQVAGGNPFVMAGGATDALHVAFLDGVPAAAKIAGLDVHRSVPDEFAVKGREIYLRLPNGVARSKLTNAYFDAKLGVTSTVRNWRTVLKLIEMCAS